MIWLVNKDPAPGVVNQERNRTNNTMTPIIARTQSMNIESSVFSPVRGVVTDLNDRGRLSCLDIHGYLES